MSSKDLRNVCDEKVYRQLYIAHAKNLYHFLYFKYKDQDIAEDAVQESFAEMWIKCEKIIYEAVKSFLYTVANRKVINEYRKKQVQYKHHKQVSFSDETNESPEFLMEESEFHGYLKSAIADLRDKQREVFLLSRLEKKTYAEIAELLQISVKAVEKRMHLALLNLREKIPNI